MRESAPLGRCPMTTSWPECSLMGPGGYRFNDYWRLGLPVLAWWLVVTLVVVPLVWQF